MDRLSSGEKMLGIAGAVLIVTSILKPWAKIDAGIISVSFNGWSQAMSFLVKLALFLVLVAVVLVGIRAAGVSVDLPVPWGLAYVALAGGATLLLVLGLLVGPKEPSSRGLFMILSPLLAAVAAYGGYQHMQSESSGSATPPPAA